MKRLVLITIAFIGTLSVSTQCYADVYLGDNDSFNSATPEVASVQLMVEKRVDVLLVYCPLYVDDSLFVCYPLRHRFKAFSENAYPSYLDNWGIMQPYSAKLSDGKMECVDVLFNVGESELSVSLPTGEIGSNRIVYVGGNAHGFENIVNGIEGRSFRIHIDGEEIKEDSVLELRECVNVNVQQETELVQAYTNTNPWSTVTKNWRFTEDSLTISTGMTILRDIHLTNSLFGMFCVYRHKNGDPLMPYLTSRAVKNNDPTVYNVEDGWDSLAENLSLRTKDHDCTSITLTGDLDYEFTISITDAQTLANGGMNIGTNGLSYNKVYYDLTGSYQPQIGEILSAKQIWKISMPDKEETPTNIVNINKEHESSPSVYTITGQRLFAPQRGINIVGGKKVMNW